MYITYHIAYSNSGADLAYRNISRPHFLTWEPCYKGHHYLQAFVNFLSLFFFFFFFFNNSYQRNLAEVETDIQRKRMNQFFFSLVSLNPTIKFWFTI